MTSLFQPPAPPSRKRKWFLTRAEIVEAAARILEREGYDGLNMRSIANALKVRPAALYRYVDSRDHIDDLLFDYLMADCRLAAPTADWRHDMRDLCRRWRAQLTGKRDATRIPLARVSIGPNSVGLMEAALSALRRSGLQGDDVINAYQTTTMIVHGFATQEVLFRAWAKSLQDNPALFIAPAAGMLAAYPLVAEFAPSLLQPIDFDARFEFGLDCLVAGIERRAGSA